MTEAAAARRSPLSLEEVIKKQKQEKESLAKPRFLSRKEREALAIERRKKEVEQKQHNSSSNGPSSLASSSFDTSSKRSNNRMSDDQKPSVELDTESALRRRQYLGMDEPKRKKRKTGERKFVFDWAADEDTSQDYNPIYKGVADSSKAVTADHEPASSKKIVSSIRKSATAGTVEDLHWSEKPLDQMRERDWRIFKEDFNISTKGGAIPNPMRSWEESGLPPAILEAVNHVGYKDPTPIQRASIPIAMSNRDVLGIAETGSGKTAAFVLPMLSYILDLPLLDNSTKADGPYALILAPTRELAQQIESETKKFAGKLGFRCVSLVGGHTIEEQVFKLQEGAEIIIATPGRLVDCIERRVLVLSQCCYVVMDEADRMVDMGFEEQVNTILSALPVGNQKPDSDDAENSQLMSKYLGGQERFRQTMMFTATMPPAIERMTRQYLRRPGIVTIGTIGQAVDTVEQRIEFINSEDKKKKRMQDILRSGKFAPPVIVFVNVKKNCATVAKALSEIGWRSVILHGGKSQDQREQALSELRKGLADVLVATDLAGRGLDVSNVSLVINFNMAKNIEDYTHRIGRTGRAGKSGTAITFLTSDDADTFYDLKQMLSKSSLSKVPDELRRHEAAQQKPVRKLPQASS